MIEYAGKQWFPQELVVCIAMDAFRLCMGIEPRNFTRDQIIRWMCSVGKSRG